jgi:hypothetical protein
MSRSLGERLTARFYEWETRGRGWSVFEMPVDPEPSFFTFFGHFAPQAPVIDTGKRPGILGGLADLFFGSEKAVHVPEPQTFTEIPPVQAHMFECDEDCIAYSVILPKDQKLQVTDVEQLLLMLSYTAYPVCFEIIASSTTIHLQFTCRESDSPHVYEQIKAYFPVAVVSRYDEGLEILLPDTDTCIIDFGLADEFMRPLRMADEVTQDPFIGIFAALEHLYRGERGVIQILFQGTINPWPESIMRSVTDSKGGSFFADAPEMVKYAREKISAPLFGVCIRACGQSSSGKRAVDIAKGISAALMRLTS